MIVLIPYINLLSLSWIMKCLFLRNIAPLMTLRGKEQTKTDSTQAKKKKKKKNEEKEKQPISSFSTR